jgi:hypothetical protein
MREVRRLMTTALSQASGSGGTEVAMRISSIGALAAGATLLLAACGSNTEERAATGGLGGVVGGAIVGGPVGALVGGAVGAGAGTGISAGIEANEDSNQDAETGQEEEPETLF